MLNGQPMNLVISLMAGRPLYGPAVLIASEPDAHGDSVPMPLDAYQWVQAMAARWALVVGNAMILGQNPYPVPDPDALPSPIILTDEDIDTWLGDPQDPPPGT
jgi:hypothetical protein